MLYFFLFQIGYAFSVGTWIPVGSKSSMPHKSKIKILERDYVLWKNPINKNWSLVRDKCSHRLAPLSQGRIDPKSGCIECPYHGWQFAESGQCTKIPQAKNNEKGKRVESIPLMETGDLIWGNFPINNAEYDTKPNVVFPELDQVTNVFTRELPYSFDFLVENFMDPAHIPFAHHGLQGVRSDGINIPMQVLTSIDNDEKLEIAFCDRIMGKMRDGIVSFTSPCYYHFRVEDDDGEYKKQLMVLITPVSVGITRVHLAFINNRILDIIPKWLSHSFSNQFLETDIWLHDCELEASKSQSEAIDAYYLPTTSDVGPKVWRKWWQKHMSSIPAFASNLDNNLKPLTPTEQCDRKESHISHCIHCQKALKISKKIDNFSLLFLIFINKNPVLSITCVLLSKLLSRRITRSIYGTERLF